MTVKRCANCNHPVYQHEPADLELCRVAECPCPGFLTPAKGRPTPHRKRDPIVTPIRPSLTRSIDPIADPLPFIRQHPLPWTVESGSPGVWIEDVNNEVLLRFDPLFRTEAEALVATLNRIQTATTADIAQGILDSMKKQR